MSAISNEMMEQLIANSEKHYEEMDRKKAEEDEFIQNIKNENIKEDLYNQALGVALSKLQAEIDEINPQMLTAVVNLLKLDERNLKTTDSAVMGNFIKSLVAGNEDNKE